MPDTTERIPMDEPGSGAETARPATRRWRARGGEQRRARREQRRARRVRRRRRSVLSQLDNVD